MNLKKTLSIIVILFVLLLSVYYLLDPETKTLDGSEREKLGGTYVRLSDGYTHYRLTGTDSSKLVVLVHGGTIPIWTWDRLTKDLNNAGYRVLSYDKYGRGYSDRPNVTYDQALYKRQLFELVDKLGLKNKFDLVGLSVGGGTAVNFTAAYPEKVDKLVLISPLISNFKLPAIFQIPVIGEFVARLIGVKTIVKRFNKLIEGNPDAEKYKKLFVEQSAYKGFQQSLLSMLRNDAVRDYTKAYEKLGKQARNILLIRGAGDTEITADMLKEIRSYLPDAEFEPVKGAGHGAVFQKPEIVDSLVVGFLK
jgi:pimeloyl-ACP methyl ester carboxylesterase